jgi:PKD repeat protein
VTDDDGEINSTVTTITVANQPPIALFTVSPPPPVSLGQLLSFNASDSYDSDGSIISYIWDYDDSTSDSGVTTTYMYASPGLYLVTLTVTDDDGVSTSASQNVEVTG